MLIIVISCSHSSLSQLYSIDSIHYASQWNSMNVFVTLNVQVIFFHEHFCFCIWLSLARSGLIIQACASSTGKEWEAFLLLIAVKIVSTLHWVSCIARYRYIHACDTMLLLALICAFMWIYNSSVDLQPNFVLTKSVIRLCINNTSSTPISSFYLAIAVIIERDRQRKRLPGPANARMWLWYVRNWHRCDAAEL